MSRQPGPVIVTGMHRSRTSLVASLLARVAVDMGPRLLSPDPHNPAGYFEDVEFLDFQRRLLAACCPADDGGHPDWGWTEHERLDREGFHPFLPVARMMIAARDREAMWGWKDPRTTLLLDFWNGIAGGARYVLVYRAPWDVAESVQRLGSDVFLRHPDYAYRIWTFYNAHLLDFYVRHSDRCVLVNSTALRSRLEPFHRLLAEKLNLPVAERQPHAEDLRPELFRSTSSPDALIDLVAMAWPQCTRLLAEMDAVADISNPDESYARPLRTRLRRPDRAADGGVDVSVVIPTLNQGTLLIEAVASVERHAPARTELIVVNDGSTQGKTLEILDGLRRGGYFVVDQEQGGLAAARNRGISLARGRYILPLDDDNRLAGGFIETAVRVLDREPAIGVVYGDRDDFGLRTGRQPIPEFALPEILKANYIDACAVFRRGVWSECGGYDARMSPMEDWELWVHAAKQGWRFHRLPGITFEYRVRPSSLVTAISSEDAFARLRDRIRRKHPGMYSFGRFLVGPNPPPGSEARLGGEPPEGPSIFAETSDVERLSARASSGEQVTSWLWTELKAAQRRIAAGEEAIVTLKAEASAQRQVVRGLQSTLDDKDGRIRTLEAALDTRQAQLTEIFASTSWKWGWPVRYTGLRIRRAKALARQVRQALRNHPSTSGKARALRRAWRAGGLRRIAAALAEDADAMGRSRAWIDVHDRFRRDVRPRMTARIRDMDRQPLISVVVPTHDTPEPMLRQMLASIAGQLYPNWELCAADDGSSEPHVARILQEFRARDRRVKVHLDSINRGVSHASNRALAMATGEFVVLLDHDDLLEEQALYRVAESIVADDPDLLYSDEVLVTEDASAVKQYVFRPSFSPDLLRGHPYIVHLVGFRTELVRQIGGFDEDLRISQDYDLILRASERARTIVHIPEILYQWRVHGRSAGHRRMGEVMATSRGILQRHLDRAGEAGTILDGAGFNLFSARYPLAEGLMVAIIIPTKNHGDLLEKCIESIHRTVQHVPYHIVVVDHQSDDRGTLDYLSDLAAGATVLHYTQRFNFSAMNNWAVRRLVGNYSHYLFCNNDIEAIEPGWLEHMLERAENPSVGIAGPVLLYPDRERVQHAGVCVGAYGRAEHYAKFLRLPSHRVEPGYLGSLVLTHEVAAVTAACLLIRADAFHAADGFDEAFSVGFGDVDLCLRVGACGYRVLLCPRARLVHHESSTRGTGDLHPEDTALFQARWRPLLDGGDPYYNPALSLESTTWEVRYPLSCDLDVSRRVARRSESPNRMFVSVSRDAPRLVDVS